jgi:glycosyltransferase involved in cell wall biosynthesis
MRMTDDPVATSDGGRPLRILHVAHALPPTLGGVETYLGRLLPRLRDAGHTVLAVSGGDPQPGDGGRGIHRSPAVDRHSLLGDPSAPGADGAGGADAADRSGGVGPLLDRLAGAFRPDLVHAHNLHHFDAVLSDAVARLQATGVPVVVGVHDRVGEALDPTALARPWDLVVHASDHLRRALPTAGPSRTLHLGVDTACFHPEVPPHPALVGLSRPLIVHPARLLRWKGAHVSLEAFVAVRKAFPGATLVLPGVGPMVGAAAEARALRAELQDQADAAGVADAVHLRAFPVDEMPGVLVAATVVWYPTIADEPFGLVPLEAMAAGTPIVASRSGGMVESIEPGTSGFLVARDDPAELADVTVRLLDDAALRRRIVDGGAARARLFSMERHLGWLVDLYRSVVAGAGAGVEAGRAT